MILSFFNVVVPVLSLVVEIRAAPSYASARTWYSSQGGGLQIPVLFNLSSHLDKIIILSTY